MSFLSFRLTPSVRILFIRGFCLIPSPVSFFDSLSLTEELNPKNKVTAQYVSSTKFWANKIYITISSYTTMLLTVES